MNPTGQPDVIDVWESVTGHQLSEERQVSFAMRYEVRALGRLPLDLLYGAAVRAMIANPHGHLMLEEWLAIIQQATPDVLDAMAEEGAARASRDRPEDGQ